MEQPLYIVDEPLKPGLDYYYLRAEGIKFIQQLTGSFWTDYNEHDPGVTILEQLCFALTDLSYRTEFEIQDHFYSKNKQDFSFLKPNELFPSSALTIQDYRKLIFDSVFELNNVWIIPMSEKLSSMNGLYKILLDVNDSVKDDASKLRVIQKTKEVYWKNRNTCEDLEEVKIIKHIPITFHASIEINGKISGEIILAQIYFKLKEYLSPEIRFYSLDEMLNLGYKLEEIFTGPLLKHGFIRSQDLVVKPSRILISDLIKIIMQIEGIVSVKNLHLRIDSKIYENQIEIGDEELPQLINDLDDKKEKTVNFYKGSVKYNTIDYSIAKRKLNELSSANKRVYRLSQETIKIPEGESLDLEEYFSIQDDFPLVYGIGAEGIPNLPNDKRKAQAKQLKGYLLLFEQIMANYLSQLAHAKDLFSLNAEIRQTYFYQSLEKTVPDCKPLLKQKKNAILNKNNLASTINNDSYQVGLPELVKRRDNYYDRRNRFLDYLLAIHGEAYTQYGLEQFNFYFEEHEFHNQLIGNKTRLLKSLSSINQHRAKAFNYAESNPSNNFSGFKEKISLLLGINNSKELDQEEMSENGKSIFQTYLNHDLKLLKSDTTKNRKKEWEIEGKITNEAVDHEYISNYFDFVDAQEVNIQDFSESEKGQLLNQTLPLRSKIIFEDFLREGLQIEQYKIGSALVEGKLLWYLIFNFKDGQNWIQIGVYQSERETIAAMLVLMQFLKELNMESECIYVVEHLLLRPELNDSKYGLFMLAQDGKPLLRSKQLYTFEERKIALAEIQNHIRQYENYSVETTPTKDFEVHFTTSDFKHTFVSMIGKPSVEETHQDMELLYKLMSDQLEIIPYKNKVGLYVRYSEDVDLIPEDFFSYRCSIVLPSWSARFHNEEFKSIAEDIVFENCPANISSQILWVNTEEMEAFEEKYFVWMEEMAKENLNKNYKDQLNNELALMLLNLKK